MLGCKTDVIINPLIILGAGASHDLVSTTDYNQFPGEHWQPPLTDDLFNSRNPIVRKVVSKYKAIPGLVGTIRRKLEKGDKSLEEILDEEKNPGVLNDYLAELMYTISTECSKKIDANNYDIFFKSLHDKFFEFMVINFNYDFLAQKALMGAGVSKYEKMDDYWNNSIKLIHVHGSVAWNTANNGEIQVRNIQNANKSNPRLTIPVGNSGKNFGCPESHVIEMQDFVENKTNALVLIGWKGKERHFKEVILSRLQNNPKRIIVVGSEESLRYADLTKRKNLGKGKALKVLESCGLDRFAETEVFFVAGFSTLLDKFLDFSEIPNEDEEGKIVRLQ